MSLVPINLETVTKLFLKLTLSMVRHLEKEIWDHSKSSQEEPSCQNHSKTQYKISLEVTKTRRTMSGDLQAYFALAKVNLQDSNSRKTFLEKK